MVLSSNNKILVQRLWEITLDWDDPIPEHIHQVWSQWRSELSLLMTMHIPRCYSSTKEVIVSTQLNGFSDASKEACLPTHWILDQENSYFSRHFQDESVFDQETIYTQTRALWSSNSHLIALPHKENTQDPCELRLHMDRQHCCSWLFVW